MNSVLVTFLGDQYQVSKAVNEFFQHERLLDPMRKKVLKTLEEDFIKYTHLTFEDQIPNVLDEITTKYRNLMYEEINLLLNKLESLGVYDVEFRDLLNGKTYLDDIKTLGSDTMMYIMAEGNKYLEYKQAGMENAYYSAASKITGSGLMTVTGSLTGMFAHVLAERNVLMSQAKEADREYASAVQNIERTVYNKLDRMIVDTICKMFYPQLIDLMFEFDRSITARFMEELRYRGKFDFESIAHYDGPEAEAMLTNIHYVKDKEYLLKQAFEVCPFCLKVYERCFEFGLLDIDTLKTAEYFDLGEEIVGKIDTYLQQNSNNPKLIEPVVQLLAEYKEINANEIWYDIYKSTIENIEVLCCEIFQALEDKTKLDEVIRKYISSDMMELVKIDCQSIKRTISEIFRGVGSEEVLLQLFDLGFVSLTDDASVINKGTCVVMPNHELREKLVMEVMAYIDEANRRLSLYKESKDQLETELKIREEELRSLKNERRKLGFFAFSKKRELDEMIESQSILLKEFENSHKSKVLLKQFQEMYK